MPQIFRILFILLCATSATAQSNEPSKLFLVTDGVFNLQEGQSIDLTDEHLLLTLVRGKDNCVAIAMNGGVGCVTSGQRFHLKNLGNAPFYIRGMFSEKEKCILDVFNIVMVKGQKATADFRLLCA